MSPDPPRFDLPIRWGHHYFAAHSVLSCKQDKLSSRNSNGNRLGLPLFTHFSMISIDSHRIRASGRPSNPKNKKQNCNQGMTIISSNSPAKIIILARFLRWDWTHSCRSSLCSKKMPSISTERTIRVPELIDIIAGMSNNRDPTLQGLVLACSRLAYALKAIPRV